MGACFSEDMIPAEKITSVIDKFFKGLAVRKLGIEDLKTKLKSQIFSTKVADVNEWKSFLKKEVVNSEFGQTSKLLVDTAMDDAEKNYNDKTLPFTTLLFLSDSKLETFTDTFKTVNYAQHAGDAASDVKNVYDTVKKEGIFSGIKEGINAIKKTTEVAKQTVNPNMIKKDDLKKMTNYYINFITLLPVDIIDKVGEGGQIQHYITNVLNKAFNEKYQNQFVEEKLFSKYNNQDTINIQEFFNDNYATMKDDQGIRVGLVKNFIRGMAPSLIRKQ